MKLDKESMLEFLVVKHNCTVEELVGHINIVSSHFGGTVFTDEEVLSVLKEVDLDKESGHVLLRIRPHPDYPMDLDPPWYIVQAEHTPRYTMPGYDPVPW